MQCFFVHYNILCIKSTQSYFTTPTNIIFIVFHPKYVMQRANDMLRITKVKIYWIKFSLVMPTMYLVGLLDKKYGLLLIIELYLSTKILKF
jgi:hypothetical protein